METRRDRERVVKLEMTWGEKIALAAVVLFMISAGGIGYWLQVRNLNRYAYEVMRGFMPGQAENLIAVSLDKNGIRQVELFRERVHKLNPKSEDLKNARIYFGKALVHLRRQLEAEKNFAEAARAKEYDKARRFDEESSWEYAEAMKEYRRASYYLEQYQRKLLKRFLWWTLP